MCFTVRGQRSPPSLPVSCLSTAGTMQCCQVATSVTWPEWGFRETRPVLHKSESFYWPLKICLHYKHNTTQQEMLPIFCNWHILQFYSDDSCVFCLSAFTKMRFMVSLIPTSKLKLQLGVAVCGMSLKTAHRSRFSSSLFRLFSIWA